MKKRIILLIIGSMFVFVSVQSALKNKNKTLYNSQYQFNNTGNKNKVEKAKSPLSVEMKKNTTEQVKKSKKSEIILSD